jgi:hypothetical protein
MKRFAFAGLLLLDLLTAACGDDSPTAPSAPNNPSPAVTSTIALEGDLAFGDVLLGSSATKTIRVLNRGTGGLTVSGIGWPSSGNVFTANWTSGAIAPNQWQDVVVTFTPSTATSYTGNATIQSNAASGTNTMAVSARGFREAFVRSGAGNTVFDMPTGVTRLRIQGTPNSSCENFIVWIGGRLIVNDIIGTCSIADGRTYDGSHAVSGTVVEVRNSSGVRWTMTELR